QLTIADVLSSGLCQSQTSYLTIHHTLDVIEHHHCRRLQLKSDSQILPPDVQHELWSAYHHDQIYRPHRPYQTGSHPSHVRYGIVWHPDSNVGLSQTSLPDRSEEHTSELQSRENLVCRL